MSDLQQIDWHDLRDYVERIDEHRVTFLFLRGNEPKITYEVLERLRSHFKSFEWYCEPIAMPDFRTGIMKHIPGNEVRMTLEFKSSKQHKETLRLLETSKREEC